MYGKLFTQMYDGTLATKGPWQALVTFQQLIILADPDGNVDMTPDAISRRTTVPLDIIHIGLDALQQPDDQSRSPALEGRRIIPLSPNRSWGWNIVNHAHYSKIRSQDQRREYMRQYQAQRRATERTVKPVNARKQSKQMLALSTDIDIDINTDIDTRKNTRARSGKTSISESFSVSERVRQWAEKGGYDNLDRHLESFIAKCQKNSYAYANWDSAFMDAIREDWARLKPVKNGATADEIQNLIKEIDDADRRNSATQ